MAKLEAVKTSPAPAAVHGGGVCLELDPSGFSEEITDWDIATFRELTCEELTAEQRQRVLTPDKTHPRQDAVLAVHWHPEYVPMDLIMARVDAMYPNRRQELIIPTQHNVLMSLNGYAGVEVDCYSRGFNRKVQLLVHMSEAKAAKASAFKGMLQHTFQYRTGQLHEFLDSLIEPAFEDRMRQAAGQTGASEELVRFVRAQAVKLRKLIDTYFSSIPPDAFKNKLVRNYLDALRQKHDPRLIQRAQALATAVKQIVKARFRLDYFFRTSEIIEEARGLGAGVVIPHPEQFWPILLADYDVDGIEVWNPQSQEYTEFLINVVIRKNQTPGMKRQLLIFMGDDCHMSEKLKEPTTKDPEKSGREVGLQSAWDDLNIRKSAIIAGVTRQAVIEDYRARLD